MPNVSARVSDEMYEYLKGRLDDCIESGKRIPLKTKGKFRDMRMSDVIVDMLADAIIKDDCVLKTWQIEVENALEITSNKISFKVNNPNEAMLVHDYLVSLGYMHLASKPFGECKYIIAYKNTKILTFSRGTVGENSYEVLIKGEIK